MMVKTSAKKVKEGTVFFDDDRKSGVFIQAQFKRCLFFVDGITLDILDYDSETVASILDKWISEKRKLYEKEKASRLQPNEA